MSTQPFLISTDTIQATLAQYFSASRSLNKVEAMVACFAEDCVNYDPAEGPALQGQAALQQFFQTIVDLFETVGLQEEFISINGHQAAVKWTGQGISRNQIAVTFEGIDLFEFNAAGQIQTMRAYWNPTAMLAQLA